MAATTPLADVLTADGALLGERDGWLQALRFTGVEAEWLAAQAGRAVADRSARGFLRVHGRDAAKLLQGIVTSDVDALDLGQAQPSLLLTPKGRVVADLTILRADEDAFVVASAAAAHRRGLPDAAALPARVEGLDRRRAWPNWPRSRSSARARMANRSTRGGQLAN